MDLKNAAISMTMFAFVLSSMIGMGLGLRVAEIVAPLRNWRLVTLSLVANFAVMPAVALALASLLRLDESTGIGLLLLGTASGAPFLPKRAQIARGNLAFAVGAHGPAHGDHGRLHLDRVACAAAGHLGEPGADRSIARHADLAAVGRRAGGERVSSASGGERQTGARQDGEHQPDRPDHAADVVTRGGEYGFMPGLRALRWLADLKT